MACDHFTTRQARCLGLQLESRQLAHRTAARRVLASIEDAVPAGERVEPRRQMWSALGFEQALELLGEWGEVVVDGGQLAPATPQHRSGLS
jgi:hypothetical protein